jgi:hypothetical protein
MRLALPLAILLSGCVAAPSNDVPQFTGQAFAPMHGATRQAMADCGGPYVAWSSTTSRSLFPYRVETTERMRCLKDGRVVGPYTYRTDGL